MGRRLRMNRWGTFIAMLLPALAAPAQPPAHHRALLIHCVPVYPEIARRMHVWGEVVLRIEILPDGAVGNVEIQSGHALLRRSAEDAVRQWRFAPAGVSTEFVVTVQFHPD